MTKLKRAWDRAVRASEERQWIPGRIGRINGDGSISISVAGRPNFVYVRLGAEGEREVSVARNLGVPRRAHLPVRLRLERGEMVIHGVDHSGGRLDAFLGGDEALAGIGYHTHRQGSGLEYVVQPQLFEPGLVQWSGTGLTVYINPFRYLTGVEWKTWTGGTLDLTAYAPATAGMWAWVLVGIDPETNTAVAVAGSETPLATPLVWADLDGIAFTGYIPCGAVKVKQDDSKLSDAGRYADARGWLNLGGGGSGALADLTDVEFSTLADGDLLTYDQMYARWRNTHVSGGFMPLIQSELSYDEDGPASSSAFAAKGVRVIPTRAMTLYALCYPGDTVAGASYKAWVVTHDGSAVTEVVAESPAYTVAASGEDVTDKRHWLFFEGGVPLDAGTEYGLLISRTDGAGTYALPMLSAANSRTPFGNAFREDNYIQAASATLAVSTAVETATAAPFALGYCWSYDDVTVAFSMAGLTDYVRLGGAIDTYLQVINGGAAAGGQLWLRGSSDLGDPGLIFINDLGGKTRVGSFLIPAETFDVTGTIGTDEGLVTPQITAYSEAVGIAYDDGNGGRHLMATAEVGGDPVTLIPDGPDDVKTVLLWEAITTEIATAVTQVASWHSAGTLAPGSDVTIFSNGSNGWKLQVLSDGAIRLLDIVGTTGAANVSVRLFWR